MLKMNAQFMIALMLREQGDISVAITELENLLAAYPDLSSISTKDYEAAIKPNGYLIECEPPFDVMPIWRVQYDACMLLINLYQLHGKKVKALDLSLKLASNISPDGWHWNINRHVVDICIQKGEWNSAAEQYELSMKGIRRIK